MKKSQLRKIIREVIAEQNKREKSPMKLPSKGRQPNTGGGTTKRPDVNYDDGVLQQAIDRGVTGPIGGGGGNDDPYDICGEQYDDYGRCFYSDQTYYDIWAGLGLYLPNTPDEAVFPNENPAENLEELCGGLIYDNGPTAVCHNYQIACCECPPGQQCASQHNGIYTGGSSSGTSGGCYNILGQQCTCGAPGCSIY